MGRGFEVYTSIYMVEAESFWSWEPCGGGWKKKELRVRYVPRKEALFFGNKMVVHPALLPALRAATIGRPL